MLFYARAVGCHKFDQFLPKRLWHNTGGETTFCQWTELGRSWFKWSVTLFHSLFFWMLYIKSSCVMLPLIWLVGMFFGWCKFSLSLSLSLSVCVLILGKWINSDGTTLAYTNFLLFFFFFFLGILLFFKKITMSFTCNLVNHPWSDHYLVFFLCKLPIPFFFFFCVWLFPTLKWIYLSKNNLEFLACQIRILWCLQLMLKYFRNLLICAILWSLQL